MGLIERTRRNISFKSIGELVSRLLAVIFFIYVARKLGAVEFGKYSFAFCFCGLFLIFFDLGLNTLLIRDVAREKSVVGKYAGELNTIKILLAGITFGLINLVIRLLNYPPGMISLVALMSIVVIGTGFLEYFVAIFNSVEKMGYEAELKILSKVFVFGLGTVALVGGYGLPGLVKLMASGYLITFVIGLVIVQKRITRLHFSFQPEFWRYLFRNAFPLALTTIFIIIYFRIDVVMLSLMRGDNAEIGWYQAGVKLVDALGIIPALIVGGLFPIFSDLYRNRREVLPRVYKVAFKFLFILGVPIAFGTTVLAPKIICFIYGSQFFRTADVLQILIWAVVFIFIDYVLLNLLVAVDRQKLNALSTGICAGVNVIGNFILIPRYGYLGAGLATVITEIVLFLMSFYFVAHYFSVLPLFKIVWRPLLSGILMATMLFYLKGLNLGFLIFLGAGIYFLLLYTFKTFSPEEYAFLGKMLKLKEVY